MNQFDQLQKEEFERARKLCCRIADMLIEDKQMSTLTAKTALRYCIAQIERAEALTKERRENERRN